MDVDEAGMVKSLQLIDSCKDRGNTILCTWNAKLWEKNKEYGPIDVIDDKGLTTKRWIVSESGETAPLFTRMTAFPNRENVLGAKAIMDDASEAMLLRPAMRDKMIFLFVGLGIGTFFLGPIVGAMMS
ncbi:MAG: hypothetical protein EHJ95_06120 [Methanobacteriota archaeon]|nr:MAG: hypothetical protein EHJ95_06120 [Euryarchaeota archaeon]